MKRTGPLRQRLALGASRSLGVAAWRLSERLGVDIAGATEGPHFAIDRPRRETFENLIAAARAGDGTLDTAACPYPLHELLTHLVLGHGLLLHGSNNAMLEVLEPQPARDWATALRAVVACDGDARGLPARMGARVGQRTAGASGAPHGGPPRGLSTPGHRCRAVHP